VIVDSHTHLYWDGLVEDLDAVLERAREAGVERCVVVGTDVRTSEAARELAQRHAGLAWTAGLHPHDAACADPGVRRALEDLAAEPGCVAVGETGLDHFKEFSPRGRQRDSFRWHLDLARRLDKPVIVHGRDAHEDVLATLREFPGVRGVMHCYTLGPEELLPYLELGLHISFAGVVTYPANAANREAARQVPADRLLVETDCPFLAPQGFRGKRNEPAHVRRVVECIAGERGETPETIARTTSANAARLFRLEN
jgi:TatD DNase family protein